MKIKGVGSMSHKTFISYKYDESQEYRDAVIEAMGDDATYYKGETSDSPNLDNCATETIKKNLSDMIFGTSVTMIILSPNMCSSEWMEWELRYSLRRTRRSGWSSGINGLLGIVPPICGSYDWFRSVCRQQDGDMTVSYKESLAFPLMQENRFN